MLKKTVILLLVLVQSGFALSQSRPEAYKKGTFYALWGWNRAGYTNSDIHFKGNDYDFTLSDVKAKDRQSTFNYHNYFQPNRITIPQTNFKIGYFFKDNWAVNVGVDHMKYVMNQDQTTKISGTVRPEFQSAIQEGSIKLTEDFMTYEHTDGLNYINAEVEYYHNFYTKGILKVNGLLGGGAGAMLPKTNVKLMGEDRHDDFHLAGFGLDVKGGLDVSLWNVFFVRTELKEGYINMPSIRTTKSKDDKASQAFLFTEWTYMFGFNWHF